MRRQFGHFLGMKGFIPSEGRCGPHLIMLTFKGQTLDPGLKDFLCPTSTQMLLSVCCQKDSSHKHLSGPEDRMLLIQDV